MDHQEDRAMTGTSDGLLVARVSVMVARDRAEQPSDASGGRTDTNDT